MEVVNEYRVYIGLHVCFIVVLFSFVGHASVSSGTVCPDFCMNKWIDGLMKSLYKCHRYFSFDFPSVLYTTPLSLLKIDSRYVNK